MYQVNLGASILYYPANADFAIYDAKLEEEVGAAGEFSFKVPPSNPLYGNLSQGSLVTIIKDGKEYWRGEIKELSYDFAKVAEVYCLEDLAFLADEFLAPAAILDESYAQRFQAALTAYNLNRTPERQFAIGYISNVQNSDLCNWITEYDMSILDDLRECIAGDSGYLRVRRVTSGATVTRYIDIVPLATFGQQASQTIEYGYNLLDYVKESDLENLTNVLTPYGANLDTEVYEGYSARLAGTTIQNDDSIAVYGRHAKAVVFENVEDVDQLNALASAYLTRYSQPELTMEVDAVDLSGIENVSALNLGDSIHIVAAPFAVDQWLYLTKITRDLQNIDKNKITLSGRVITGQTLTSQTQEATDAIKKIPSKSSILEAAKKNAIELLNGTNGGNIYFVFNEDGQIIEQGFSNNPILDQATAISRWNINGKAILTRDNPNEDWNVKVAETIDGGIVADFITSGTMSCDRLNGGAIDGQTITGGTITGSTIRSYRNGNTSNGYTEISGGNCSVIADADNYFQVKSKADSGLYVTMGPEITVNDTSASFRIQCSLRYLGWAVYDAYQAHSSDKKLKEQIADIPVSESKDVILGARPRYYEFKDKTEKGIRSGFVAQELREALERIGNDTAIERESARREGEREVLYEDFIAHLVNTVQDLYAEVGALKEEINKMKGA